MASKARTAEAICLTLHQRIQADPLIAERPDAVPDFFPYALAAIESAESANWDLYVAPCPATIEAVIQREKLRLQKNFYLMMPPVGIAATG